MFSLFPRIVCTDEECFGEAPLSASYLTQILQNAAALHLRAMAAIQKDGAHVLRRALGSKPHGAIQPTDQSPVQVFEERRGKLAPYRGAYCRVLVHLVD